MAVPYPSVPGVTFKDIPGYPGYCVGDDGSVWSRKTFAKGVLTDTWKRLKCRAAGRSRNTWKTCLSRDQEQREVSVGVLVLSAFVGPRPNGMQCCHGDGNPANNNLSNLRWDTPSANAHDAIRHGTFARGERSGMAKLTLRDVRRIFELQAAGYTNQEIADAAGIDVANANRILNKKLWGHTPFRKVAVPLCRHCGRAKKGLGRCYHCKPGCAIPKSQRS